MITSRKYQNLERSGLVGLVVSWQNASQSECRDSDSAFVFCQNNDVLSFLGVKDSALKSCEVGLITSEPDAQ